MIPILATIVVCLVLAAAVFFAGRRLWRDKKSGKSCCGNCSGCCGCVKKPKDL